MEITVNATQYRGSVFVFLGNVISTAKHREFSWTSDEHERTDSVVFPRGGLTPIALGSRNQPVAATHCMDRCRDNDDAANGIE